MSKYWKANYNDLHEIMMNVFEMRFEDTDGWVYPHSSQKVILAMFLFEYSKEFQEWKSSDRICKPDFNDENQTIIHKYQEFADVCRYKTIKTMKKYLSLLQVSGFINLKKLDKDHFEVSINFDRILNAPKFEKDDEND